MADLALVFGTIGVSNMISDLIKLEGKALSLTGVMSTMVANITSPAGIAAIGTTIKDLAVDSVKAFGEFETAQASLQSITGASTEQLKYFSDEAMRMSDTVEGGAVATVKAMELIGSAMPKLLDDTKGLAALTEKTIMFADAASMDVPAAATALTDALNQFKADASEATAYMDALAAGAKYGSATIPQSTEALLRFGAGAKAANIDIFESTAAIQALSTTLKGAEAGTAMRNIILKMEAAGAASGKAKDIFKGVGLDIAKVGDNSLPLIDRLTEMKKVFSDVNGPVEVFGAENVIAAQALFDSLPKYEALTNQVKKHGVTAEQAAINNATLEKSFTAMSNQVNIAMIEVGKALAPVIREITDGFRPAFESVKEALTTITSTFQPFFDALGALGSAFGFAKKEGNTFATVVSMISKYFTIISIPARLFWTVVTKITEAFAGAVAGMKEFQANSPILSAVVNTLLGPFTLLGDAISWVGESLGFGGKDGAISAMEQYTATMKYAGQEVLKLGQANGLSIPEIQGFTKQIDLARYAGLTQSEAMKKMGGDMRNYVLVARAMATVTKDVEVAVSDLATTATGPASGSIDALTKKLSELRAAFTATGSQADRKIIKAEIAAITDEIERLSGARSGAGGIKGMVSAFSTIAMATATAKNDLASVMAMSGGADQPIFQDMGALLAKSQSFGEQMKQVFASLKESVKNSMVQMAQDVAFNVGEAIGSGASVGDVFKNVLRELAVMIPKMVGMAMINQAAMVPSPASLPLAIAGLALIGASGIISGVFKAKDAKKADIPEVGGSAPMPTPDRRGLDSFGEGAGRTEAVIYIDGPSGERLTGYMERKMTKADMRRG